MPRHRMRERRKALLRDYGWRSERERRAAARGLRRALSQYPPAPWRNEFVVIDETRGPAIAMIEAQRDRINRGEL